MRIARLDDPRLPPYAPDEPIDDYARRLGLDRIAKLDANESHLGPFPGTVEAARALIGHAHRYPELGTALIAAIAARHAVDPTQVALGHGGDALIGQLFRALVRPGDEVVVAEPGFPTYVHDAVRCGATLVGVPLTGDGATDLAAMAAAVGAQTAIVAVCNPHNPTGGVVARDAIDAFVGDMPEGVTVVLDEAYADYVDDDPQARPVPDHVVRLRTFSKMFGLAGLRVGYLLGAPALITAVNRLRHWYEVSDAAIAAAAVALDQPLELSRRRAAVATDRVQLERVLRRHGLCPFPSHGPFLTSPTRDADGLAAALAQHGVLIRATAGLVRIAVCDQDDLARLDAALAAAQGARPGSSTRT